MNLNFFIMERQSGKSTRAINETFKVLRSNNVCCIFPTKVLVPKEFNYEPDKFIYEPKFVDIQSAINRKYFKDSYFKTFVFDDYFFFDKSARKILEKELMTNNSKCDIIIFSGIPGHDFITSDEEIYSFMNKNLDEMFCSEFMKSKDRHFWHKTFSKTISIL